MKNGKEYTLSTQTKNCWGAGYFLIILPCIKRRKKGPLLSCFVSKWININNVNCQREGFGFLPGTRVCGFRLTFLPRAKARSNPLFLLPFGSSLRNLLSSFALICLCFHKSMLKPHPQDKYFFFIFEETNKRGLD